MLLIMIMAWGGGKGRGKLPGEEGEKGNAGKTIGQN
jgi:hypothetical protein